IEQNICMSSVFNDLFKKYFDFFFQAEEGIRDRNVTGVQTCALPILRLKRNVILKRKRFSMLKAIMFDLDDTLLWDEKSVHEAFKSTCEQVVNQYNVDPEALEKRVRYHAKRLYPTYDAYEFAKRIGTGVFEAMWGDYNDD